MADSEEVKLIKKKQKSPYDPPSDVDEEDEHDNEDLHKAATKDYDESKNDEIEINIDMNKQKDNNKEFEDQMKQKEFAKNKSLHVIFLRKFLSIYIGQVAFVGLLLLITLVPQVDQFLLKSSWIAYIGTGIFLILMIPIFLGLSRINWGQGLLMAFIIVSMTMIFSYVTTLIGPKYGLVCYFGLISGLLSIMLYTLIVNDDRSYNFIYAFLSSLVFPTILLISFCIGFKENGLACALGLLGISLYLLIITYSCELHITTWLEESKYKEDEILHPAVRLHFDFFMLFLRMISTFRKKLN